MSKAGRRLDTGTQNGPLNPAVPGAHAGGLALGRTRVSGPRSEARVRKLADAPEGQRPGIREYLRRDGGRRALDLLDELERRWAQESQLIRQPARPGPEAYGNGTGVYQQHYAAIEVTVGWLAREVTGFMPGDHEEET